jgi:hypothetical protein
MFLRYLYYTIYYSNCSPFPLWPTLMKKGYELNSNLGKQHFSDLRTRFEVNGQINLCGESYI